VANQFPFQEFIFTKTGILLPLNRKRLQRAGWAGLRCNRIMRKKAKQFD
jgi:hypothetical protein